MNNPGVRRPVILSIAALIIIALQRVLRDNFRVMHSLSRVLVRPIHRFLAELTGHVGFSVAELLILLTGVAVIVWLIGAVIRLLINPGKGIQLLHIFLSLAALVLCIYAGFCVLWGVYYYGEDFSDNTGIYARDISTEELKTVTSYFAELANQYAQQVPRDQERRYQADRNEILRKSKDLYRETVEDYPGLDGPKDSVKPFHFSKILSLAGFTGFFFPFTGEANVNTDFPPSQFAATVAHEIAHQRGVATEQEANFCAVLASFRNGDPDYCYSAALMAYVYLGNALYESDPQALEEIRAGLCNEIKTDLAEDRAYWEQYETPVQSVSNTVYEEFLYSYDQKLGLKSYGACVDLLVSYYLDKALAFQE